MKKKDAIATKPDVEAALAEYDSIVDAEPTGFNPTIVSVKINHGDETFTLGGQKPEKRMNGVILAAKMVRVFFPKMGDDAETKVLAGLTGNRPFCGSADHVNGTLADVDWSELDKESTALMIKTKIAEGALDCYSCPFGGSEAWGSVQILGKSGNAKACADVRRLLFWQPGVTIPIIMPIPPSSIRRWDEYCSGLESVGERFSRVLTEITLEHRTGSIKGREYSVVNFTKDADLTDDTILALMTTTTMHGESLPLAKALIALFNDRELGKEDYDNGVTTTSPAEDDFAA